MTTDELREAAATLLTKYEPRLRFPHLCDSDTRRIVDLAKHYLSQPAPASDEQADELKRILESGCNVGRSDVEALISRLERAEAEVERLRPWANGITMRLGTGDVVVYRGVVADRPCVVIEEAKETGIVGTDATDDATTGRGVTLVFHGAAGAEVLIEEIAAAAVVPDRKAIAASLAAEIERLRSARVASERLRGRRQDELVAAAKLIRDVLQSDECDDDLLDAFPGMVGRVVAEIERLRSRFVAGDRKAEVWECEGHLVAQYFPSDPENRGRPVSARELVEKIERLRADAERYLAALVVEADALRLRVDSRTHIADGAGSCGHPACVAYRRITAAIGAAMQENG